MTIEIQAHSDDRSGNGRRLADFQNDLENALAKIRFDSLQQACETVSSEYTYNEDAFDKGLSALEHFTEAQLFGLARIARKAVIRRKIQAARNG